MKKFVIKDTIINQENGKTIICFWGKDGFIHDEPKYVEAYQRKGSVVAKINKELNSFYMVKVDDNHAIEGKKWLHTFEIVEL